MTKRILSFVLVVVMLLGICVSTASCVQLEEFIGYENLPEDYLDKYYPDREQAGGENDDENNGENGGGSGVIIPNKHDPDVERLPGHNLLTFYWNNRSWTSKESTLAKCDMWCWWDGADGKGYLWKQCEYGAMVTFNIPEEVTEVGFIVRKNCNDPGGTSWGNAQKDCGEDDLFATIEGPDTFIYLKGGKSDQYHSNDGGKTLQVIQKFNLAGMVDTNKIEYIITPATKFTGIEQFKVFDGDREIKISNVSSIDRKSATGIITVDEELDITKTYTVKIDGFKDSRPVVPTDIFDTEEFAKEYHYDGNDLGATINGNGTTTFKVWAPTASKVVLNLFEKGDAEAAPDAYEIAEMVRGEKGVWSYTANCGHGTYYTYSVTTAIGTQEAVDPYAKSAGLNGNRGMVIDLDTTDPEGWAEDQKFNTGIDSYSDAIVWEVHVRDFSNTITNSQYKGKYLAFTEEGLVNENGIPVGIDYLKALGVNFVHLLPVYDYATVKEENPDSGFNWGYDPKNYNVPEGSYSTDPYNGEVRVKEFKQMVMALHEAGIGVVMDVVYNHTFDKNASFNRIVPYYYYRYKSNGANSSGSGCGNDTASERYMFGKFMVDSTSYWMDEYNLDGFRFDLMGLHDVDTMQKVESAVHKLNPQAILYGEGWTMMQNSYDPSLKAATQQYISMIKPTNGGIGAVAVFNDIIRTGLKAESDDATKGYINGDASSWKRDRVLFGVNGGIGATAGANWKTETAMVVNYMSAHDNSTLWDKLTVANGNSSKQTRLAMNRLGATILFVSKGIVFFQAGEEMLRTKPNDKYDTGYDHNSYKSSDEINNLKWNTLSTTSDEYKMFQYYAGLCAIRTGIDIFTNNTKFTTYAHGDNSGFSIKIEDGRGGHALVIVNPDQYKSISYGLDRSYELICNGVTAGTTSIETKSGTVSVPPLSAYILVTNNLIPNN
ncbi:MAG: type I pullulanase [Clostridia bacterium]|nr:type I pullulanase [Clostridia bacterium]